MFNIFENIRKSGTANLGIVNYDKGMLKTPMKVVASVTLCPISVRHKFWGSREVKKGDYKIF